MDARKATAAVSAAGIILIAGCGGGGKSLGTSLPGAQNGLHSNTQPANSSRVALKFTLPARNASGWTAPAYQPAYKQRRAKAFTPKKSRASSFRRKPQYISYGLLGGSITISVYQTQNGTPQLALTQGPFTVGLTYGAYDFYCAYVPAAGVYECVNYSNVFAPLGNDTFFAVMSNPAGQSLSATPGWPGTNYVAATQSSYTITASGYPSPISIQTYAVASSLAIDAPTSCIDPSGSPLVAETFLADASGYPISGNLANAVTINVTGNFALYNLYAQQLTTPYTVTSSVGYFNGFELVGAASGSAGAVSVSSNGGAVGINLTPSTTRNLYAVDRLALSPSTSGINVVGLVDSGPSAYNCGTLPIANYATGAPITSFSNPVAIGGDDYIPGVGVLDSVSGTPYLSLISLNRFDFGDFLETGGIINAEPAEAIQVAGHNPLAVSASPSSGVGSGLIYILNADGSIQIVNDYSNFGATSTLEPAGTIGGPVDVSVFWNESGSFDGDYVFATSLNSPNLYEISNADTSPSLNTIDMRSASSPSLIAPTTYAVSADNIDGLGYISFVAFDSGNGGADSLVSCTLANCSSAFDVGFSSNNALAAGETTFNYSSGGVMTGLVANGTSVAPFVLEPFASPQPTSAPLPSFSNPVTQMVTTYDGMWNGISTGGLVQFFYNLGGTVAGSVSGTHTAIVSPYGYL